MMMLRRLSRTRSLFTASTRCLDEYRTGASCHARQAATRARVLYVVGGLYGNTVALEALKHLVSEDVRRNEDVAVVFNGDFNFFNASEAQWVALNDAMRSFGSESGASTAHTKGNVEMECARPAEATVGCGCAYPAHVDPGVPLRASQIVERLHAAAHACGRPDLLEWLSSLPTFATFAVGDNKRVAVVHGDPTCVNGWSLAHDADTDDGVLRTYFQDSRVDVVACTHTCTAHLRTLDDRYVVANNGTAAMPNFDKGSPFFGLATRVAAPDAKPPPVDPVYGVEFGDDGTRVDAIPIHFDVSYWFDAVFTPLWPAGSPAATSYATRITSGYSPEYTPVDACAHASPALLRRRPSSSSSF